MPDGGTLTLSGENTAVDEDVDLVGLSILSGAHLTLVPLVVQALRAAECDVPVVVGGIIPDGDVAALLEAGVAATFGPGSSLEDIIATLERLHAAHLASSS